MSKLTFHVANLLPRRGRDKPGCEGDDRLRGVAGEADTYGCLAVDNLYNIMHTTDRKHLRHISAQAFVLTPSSNRLPRQCHR